MLMMGRISDWLFAPDQDRIGITWLFLKALAIVYLGAFLSLAVQIDGLVGQNGILPVSERLASLYAVHDSVAWFRVPTIFWINSSDVVLVGSAYAGVVFSLLLFAGIFQRLSLIAMFLLYLSLFHAGQTFMNFQWDYLLLETGFLAIFLAGRPNRLIVFLFHWLLFRLRFLSGFSKLQSEDPVWSGLETLKYYFETQPLPHIGSWYAHQLPEWMLRFSTATVLFAELVVPFFIFLPRPFRLFAAAITILIQLAIIATSNHNFINLLTIVLCLFLLDDRIFRSRGRSGKATVQLASLNRSRLKSIARGTTLLAAGLVLFTSISMMSMMFMNRHLPNSLMTATHWLRAYGVGNIYHVFPIMQTERQELIIQGSHDGREWKTYVFRYKPTYTDQAPEFIVPHQPRLDWMMWFVPTQNPALLPWFDRFIEQLYRNEPGVTALLEKNPFSDRAPRYIRVLTYRYRFSTPDEREKTGHWWKAKYLGQFPNVKPRIP
jgi:hypothetical protein